MRCVSIAILVSVTVRVDAEPLPMTGYQKVPSVYAFRTAQGRPYPLLNPFRDGGYVKDGFATKDGSFDKGGKASTKALFSIYRDGGYVKGGFATKDASFDKGGKTSPKALVSDYRDGGYVKDGFATNDGAVDKGGPKGGANDGPTKSSTKTLLSSFDAINVSAVFLISFFAGSGITFAIHHFRRSTLTTLKQPLMVA